MAFLTLGFCLKYYFGGQIPIELNSMKGQEMMDEDEFWRHMSNVGRLSEEAYEAGAVDLPKYLEFLGGLSSDEQEEYGFLLEIHNIDDSRLTRLQQQALFVEMVYSLRNEEVCQFASRWIDLERKLYTANVLGACDLWIVTISDRVFEEFRGWIVLQGKDVYSGVQKDADSLASLLNDRVKYPDPCGDWVGRVPFIAYEYRSGGEEIPGKYLPTDMDSDKIEERIPYTQFSEVYPALWALYGAQWDD